MQTTMGTLDQAKCIIFDFDGTLFRLSCDWEGMRSALSAQFSTCSFKSITQGLNQVEAEFGPEALRLAYQTIAKFEGQGGLVPLQDQIELLRNLANQGKQIGIFSANCYDTVKRGLSSAGLDPIVKVIISGDASPSRKPDPAGLLIAMDELGVRPSETCYIADGEREGHTASQIGVAFINVA